MTSYGTERPGDLRLGIIGLGRVFRFGYTPWLAGYLHATPHVRLEALCDLDENTGVKYARAFGCGFFPDAGTLLDSGHVDAVIVNTPTWTHEELVTHAASRGIHVLCEKPMAATLEACDRMISTCEENGVLLLIGFMRRFNKAFQKTRELVRAGAIGELIELEADWPYFIPDIDSPPYAGALSLIKKVSGVDIPVKYGAWRLKDTRVGGGDFLDHGPHIIDFFRWVAGDVTHVSGESRVLVPGRNEDFTRCALKFAGGATGHITTTLYDFKSGLVGKMRCSVRGTAGRIEFMLPNTDRFKPVGYLTLYAEPRSAAGRLARGLGLMRRRKVRLERNRVFEEMLDYFAGTILGSRRIHPVFGDEFIAADGRDGRYSIEVVELCYRSASSAPSWLEMGEGKSRPPS